MPIHRTLPAAPLFDRTRDGRSFVPTSIREAGAHSGGPGRPSGRRVSALPWTAASTPARFRIIGTLALLLALSSAAHAQPAPSPEAPLGELIAEAAQRFGIPEAWIRAVMRVESAFDKRAVSRAGAMGLMQVMPQTYADLRARYGLGADPFQPRDNVLAGAAYLREMYDRFGSPGFLAAYNAGPARYQAHVAAGRPLPSETRAYVAKLAPAVGGSGVASAPTPSKPPSMFVALGASARPVSVPAAPTDPAFAPLFAELSTVRSAD